MPCCERCGSTFPNPLAVRRHAPKCTVPEQPKEPPAPAWAEAAWDSLTHTPEETPEQQEQRQRKEQMEQAFSTDGPRHDIALHELKAAAAVRPSAAHLEEERVRFEPVSDFQPEERDKFQDSVSTRGGNSYYQSTKPVEMGKPPPQDSKANTHLPIKNYQWYDSTTFTKNTPHVRMFVELEGVGELSSDQIIVAHDEDHLSIEVLGLQGADHWLKITLFKKISGFKLKQKPNKLVVDLIKKPGNPYEERQYGTKWASLTQ
eukprot:TRINITY_DN20335_c0_g1_i1.p1 TRINITY_DN20335_c0_g1~~TRINITY_DN20335_c0_g1_i1.p1  ORF type:complete len:260 (-),score=64.91 TRINITY_DN20335_c0_g1_i1:366-1145(-)